MALTSRQANLLRVLNQLSQNIAANSGLNTDLSVDLPGLDVDLNVGIGDGSGNGSGNGSDNGSETCPPTTPTTIREVLCNALNEQVQVTTPFGMVSGLLIAVRNDYIVLIESGTGDQVLVRIDKIEFISQM
ncbi:DUF2642 domain-containing protein [Virgibacillus dakarensis]|uniref:DUF2642 domain-containing protein n=1 Tax=Virgibacillus dakarensis TaxID=1917889 RepID=UPI000B4512CF|nr:DUF2642 domain-containing protein [Virgibacillus dakarensis]MTW87810.1 DUF2642 domain-containing protein [Virgibacillus dakarensis]